MLEVGFVMRCCHIPLDSLHGSAASSAESMEAMPPTVLQHRVLAARPTRHNIASKKGQPNCVTAAPMQTRRPYGTR
jgi:hypothetical protein